MALPMDFAKVFSQFARVVLVETTIGNYVNDEWQETLLPVPQPEPAPTPEPEPPVDPDFGITPPYEEPVDPDFGVYPPDMPVDPGFTVDGPIDPDFTVDPLPVYQREIKAIVLMDSIEQQQFYADGNSTSGVLAVICNDKLYIADAFQGGQERRQSYVIYDGLKYKVSASGKLFGNTNKHLYHCVRYLQ